jgi:hypothetical protein
MGISMNSRTSGFRKWSEAHDPKIIGARAVEAAAISAPELDPPVKTAWSVARSRRGYALKPDSVNYRLL